MALFNLLGGGISFGTEARNGINILSGSPYEKSLLKYPSDLGAVDKGHYILININEQINTSFPGTEVKGDLPTVQENRQQTLAQAGAFDAISAASNILNVLPDVVKTVTGIGKISEKIDANIGIRTIRRITDTVALYMPDTLSFNHSQSYPKLSASSTKIAGISAAIDTFKNSSGFLDTIGDQLNSVAPFVANSYLKKYGDFGKVLFAAGTGGKTENPMMEILYSSPEFRSFRFDFILAPRSEKEGEEVQNIINLLKFHQAPELVQNSGGLFLYPPSEFDISFHYNGQVNTNIPKISTCVLSSIDTDYAPGGFAAYEVPEKTASSLRSETTLGGTGMPVAIRLSLGFTETEYLVKGSPLLPNNKTFTKQPQSSSIPGKYGEENGVTIK
jgi:hypothetical protein